MCAKIKTIICIYYKRRDYLPDLLATVDFCLASFNFALAGGFFEHLVALLVGFTELTFAEMPLSLSLLFSGLNMLFFLNFLGAGSNVFPAFSRFLLFVFAEP